MKQEENVCAKCACFRAKGLRCKNQPLGITHPETESCSRFEERCCGNCCWFCFEQTDGDGQCPDSDGAWRFTDCGDTPCKDYVSRQEMRHHMAVFLQWERYNKSPRHTLICRVPSDSDMNDAMKFAYKYMKVFSKL